MGIKPAAGLGGDDDLFAPILTQLAQQSFAAAVAIDIGRVKEIDPTVHRLVQRGYRLLVIYLSPRAANGPSAKTAGRHAPARPS